MTKKFSQQTAARNTGSPETDVLHGLPTVAPGAVVELPHPTDYELRDSLCERDARIVENVLVPLVLYAVDKCLEKPGRFDHYGSDKGTLTALLAAAAPFDCPAHVRFFCREKFVFQSSEWADILRYLRRADLGKFPKTPGENAFYGENTLDACFGVLSDVWYYYERRPARRGDGAPYQVSHPVAEARFTTPATVWLRRAWLAATRTPLTEYPELLERLKADLRGEDNPFPDYAPEGRDPEPQDDFPPVPTRQVAPPPPRTLREVQEVNAVKDAKLQWARTRRGF